MRYILDVSGHDLKLIRASIVNFQRSLEISDQSELDTIVLDVMADNPDVVEKIKNGKITIIMGIRFTA